ILASAMAATVFYEWNAMARSDSGRAPMPARIVLVVILAMMIAGLPAFICFGLLALGILLAFALERGRARYWSAGGLAYALVPALSVAFLRGHDDAGLKAIIFLFVVVW